ncbi:tumor necrosis factor receptor superfamily member 1A-like isoform X1 [Mercenaria mercenaria]|uniref:tumor necrosis factor receptor superfamily member 1A-like isoform X1 n=1 Tax=Mercenaria mercenaria TaxID=6596 RepID=UPI00234E60AA|nr:tumor necrosis factor receptor superfamily member 1A-like isoform X1 [Mercenaria mercenaria]
MELDVSCYHVTFLSVLNLGLFLLPTFSVQAAAPHINKIAVYLPCPRSRYVVTNTNGTKRCSRCSYCPRGFQVQTKCSAYNNTICEPCPSGWYNDIKGSKCKPCSGCKLGEYIRHSCIATRDTKCRKCPKYTYSLTANVTACLTCTRCRQNEKIISKCNRFRDTVCGDCFHDHFRESSTGSCLQCSPCPYKLQHLVVPECRDKFGIHHSNICWPGKTMVLFNSKNYSNNLEITEKILDVELEDYTYFKKSVTLPVILGFVLSCAVVFISAFIVMHFTKCWRWTRLGGFRNERTFSIISEKLHENRDVTQNGDNVTVDTVSIKSIDSFSSDFEMNSESNILLDCALEVCVRT